MAVRGTGAAIGKIPTIGFLASGTPATNGQWVAAFVQRMHELGWADGRTVVLEIRWANGRPERFAEIAAEFIRMRADAIVSRGGSAYALKQATEIIPIIFAAANDPIGSGLVVSLARPGGNIPACQTSRRILPLSDSNDSRGRTRRAPFRNADQWRQSEQRAGDDGD